MTSLRAESNSLDSITCPYPSVPMNVFNVALKFCCKESEGSLSCLRSNFVIKKVKHLWRGIIIIPDLDIPKLSTWLFIALNPRINALSTECYRLKLSRSISFCR